MADLEGRELEPEILKGVASNLAVVVHGHVVPHLRKGRVHQDHLVHAEEALPHARAKQAQDGGLPPATRRLKWQLEDPLLRSECSKPACDGGGVVRVAVWSAIVEEQVAQYH